MSLDILRWEGFNRMVAGSVSQAAVSVPAHSLLDISQRDERFPGNSATCWRRSSAWLGRLRRPPWRLKA